ncbi:MAG TPA: aspartate/glutamate racemase family protein [Burkholderiaceae bacterium]|nr:aspartate/glutamate racemase family protein [Burkholderiaceae bacterium]
MTLTADALADSHDSAFLGIVMLDTQFPRPLGDIGHPATFDPPTRRVVLERAWPSAVVQSAAGLREAQLEEGFVAVVKLLAREGAKAITTSCGFLVLLQAELQAAVPVPVITSSLLQLPALLGQHGRVGVLTISSEALGREHLLAAGVQAERLDDVVVQGVDTEGEFARRILGNEATMDLARAQEDVVAAARALKVREPSLTHLVLECTNMPPYQSAIEQATGMRCWSLLDDERLLAPFR